MPSFVVRYFDPACAAVIEESATAGSEAALRDSWMQAGRVVLSLRRQGTLALNPGRRGHPFEVAWWCRELATLLRAGMTVVEAIETLHAQSRGGPREKVHSQLLRSLREGKSLSSAIQGSAEFPAVLVASVAASERTSTLSSALEDFLRYDEMLQRLRKQVVSAAIYPAVVVSFGALIATFLLLYVIPRFSRMYVDFHGALSLPTQILMAVSGALRDRLPLVVTILAGLAGALLWAWQSGLFLRLAVWMVESVAPLRRQWEHFRGAKLYQSLALMFRGGYTLDESLAVCEGMGLGVRTGQGISLARAELARGRSVVAAFAKAQLADTVDERLLAVGERSGSFDAVLQTIADRHASAFATFIERATRIVEPLLLLMVALVVGSIVVMMYMPIFDIANGVR